MGVHDVFLIIINFKLSCIIMYAFPSFFYLLLTLVDNFFNFIQFLYHCLDSYLLTFLSSRIQFSRSILTLLYIY